MQRPIETVRYPESVLSKFPLNGTPKFEVIPEASTRTDNSLSFMLRVSEPNHNGLVHYVISSGTSNDCAMVMLCEHAIYGEGGKLLAEVDTDSSVVKLYDSSLTPLDIAKTLYATGNAIRQTTNDPTIVSMGLLSICSPGEAKRLGIPQNQYMAKDGGEPLSFLGYVCVVKGNFIHLEVKILDLLKKNLFL